MPRGSMASASRPEGAPSGLTAGVAAAVAGFVCVLVGFASSYALVVEAARTLGLDAQQLATMTAALALAMGLTCLLPSLVLRIPVVTAWSTPGAALLATSLTDIPLPAALGAFMVSGLLLAAAGLTGWFAHWVHRIPVALASALLAGVLLHFGLDAFSSVNTAPLISGAMLTTFFVARRLSPRWVIPLTLLTGLLAWPVVQGEDAAAALAALQTGLGMHWPQFRPLATPIAFSLPAILGVALPLFIVTMASQNLPGAAVLRAHGYDRAPVSALVAMTGGVTALLAPLGVFAINLAAITAALCMSPEIHPDPRRRWPAAAVAGALYLLVGLFAVPLSALFLALPREGVMTVAGLALLPTIGRGLAAALAEESERDAALVTFLVAASGLQILGIGAAFWAVLAGLACHAWWRPARR
jgi:benzoate membrane transport protein